mgnify:CR=1 FL=1
MEDAEIEDEDKKCVLEIPNNLHAAVVACAELIRKLRMLVEEKTDADQMYELEARFGLYQEETRHFVPGINFENMRQIENMLLSFDGWDAVSEGWVYTQDYFYRVDGKQYRTSVLYNTGAAPTITRRVHLFKSVVDKLDLKSVAMKSNEILEHMRKTPLVCDLKVALASERILQDKDVPHLAEPHLLRFKQRRWFEIRGWRYDLTKTWQATTREDMEKQQLHDPICEFEIECSNVEDVLRRPYHSNEYIATSLLLKALDFMTVQGLAPPPPRASHR